LIFLDADYISLISAAGLLTKTVLYFIYLSRLAAIAFTNSHRLSITALGRVLMAAPLILGTGLSAHDADALSLLADFDYSSH